MSSTPARDSPSPFPVDAEMGDPVCIFCASSPGADAMFSTAAKSVGTALANAHIPAVYGGGRRGLMGVVSHAVLEAGGHVHGILPRALMSRAAETTPVPSRDANPAHAANAVSAEGIGKDLLADNYGGRLTMEVVGGMHERKAKMAKLSTGGFVVLPGGYGTLEELLEMVTWNQIGMHSLPVIVLNVDNFYSPLRALLEGAVGSGFIKPENLSLLRIIDLPGEGGNSNAARAEEWGPAAVEALRQWSLPTSAGYGFKWDDVKPADLGLKPAEGTVDAAAVTIAATCAATAAAATDRPALFTTARYTTDRANPLSRASIPLWHRHVARLQAAHAHFSRTADWGAWPGEAALWAATESVLSSCDKEGPGDWRVRILLNPEIQVQALPAPPVPFCTFEHPAPARPIYLDTQATEDGDLSYRLHKTERRDVYNAAAARGPAPHPEVLLHDGNNVLETVTSNVALYMPAQEAVRATGKEGARWVTPKGVLLPGTVRAELLENGDIVEGVISIEDWKRAGREGWKTVGFNALRGVWQAEIAA
ncbi:hypothetical protein CspeluHIS016_0603170 [Cutaneotrichosporon spelunceum]|uniref:Lysine decarboxylase n=1 Tax=Cutaneotrichosporon spelunceum TaxID=1672016 RepID=A0AAD3TXS8_9TREE|nr:hypothetical protein CspeluHIS016_0603170 [Cutaneotrichosporon spelunceum]